VGSSGSTCDYCVTRRNLGIFASAQGTHGALDYQAAARRDHNSTFGGAATGQLAAGWRSSASTRWFASVGQGYRAPNLNELFSPGFGGLFGGNPLLGPERSHSIEVGADWRPAGQQLSARAFRTRVRDLIAFEGGQTFTALNVARAAIDGVELAWGTRIGQTQLDASATWQHARDTDTGLDLLRRAERKLALAAERPVGALLVGADLQYTSPRRDFSGELGGFVLANLRVERALGAAWRVGLRLDNATDRDYEQAAGFATPRRALLLTLRYSAP
jgi:vitamin B12 transporter